MQLLAGKNALVTGSGRGFGLAIARAFAAQGASVTLSARTAVEIEHAAKGIIAAGGTAQAVAGDVSDPAAIERIYAAHVENYGFPDILVNGAAITTPYGPIGEIDVAQWWRTQEIVLRGALSFTRFAIPDMRKAGGGRIINVASIAAKTNFGSTSAYSVAKGGLVRLTEFVMLEHAADNITAFAIHPGVAFSKSSEDALTDPAAARWIPDFLELIKISKTYDPSNALTHCGNKCVELASGKHDARNGQFIDLEQNDI